MASSIFIGRWTPKILFSLGDRPYRHGQLRRQLGSVSQRMLTRTLRNLESAGLIARHVTQSKAIAVEYSLTQRGRTILAPLGGMCRWAKQYRKDVSADMRVREGRNGVNTQVLLWDVSSAAAVRNCMQGGQPYRRYEHRE